MGNDRQTPISVSEIFAATMASKRKFLALADIESNPDGNRARLQRVLNVGSTSNQALTTIMQGLGFAISRDHHVEDVGQARFEAMSRCVEMPKIGGGSVTWEFCDPCLLVARL